jgi:hypothetical protein
MRGAFRSRFGFGGFDFVRRSPIGNKTFSQQTIILSVAQQRRL